VKAGEFIFRDGDASSEMCLVLKGKLAVYRKD
jgi:CRP-like cAMP-binding protein